MTVRSGDLQAGPTTLSRRRALFLLGSAAAIGLAPTGTTAQQRFASRELAAALPPLQAPHDGTFDVLHGIRVDDPFRPLEDPTRPDVRLWIDAEDAAARRALEASPLHTEVSNFLRATGLYRRAVEHRKVGAQFLAKVADGTREQSWLEISERGDGPGRPFLDPATLGPEGQINIGNYYTDRLSQRMAYLTTENGGDAQTLRVRDIRSGVDLPDVLTGCRFTAVVWLPDGNSFYYSRPPLPAEPAHLDRTGQQLYLHRLGTPQSADSMVWRLPKLINTAVAPRANYATNQLIVSVRIGTDEKMGLWIGPIGDPSRLRPVIPIGRFQFTLIQAIGETLYAITDLEAPRGRVVRVLQSSPAPSSWHTLVPEREGVIDATTIAANRLIVREFRDLSHHVTIHDLDGRQLTAVDLGERVRVNFDRGERTATDLRLEIDDRRRPLRQVRMAIPSGQIEPVAAAPPRHILEDAIVRDTFARSRDGTTVPVTLIHLPGVPEAGPTRTLLYGYGSYGISQHSGYSNLVAAWVRLGGIYAVATVRGGSEFGRDWHENGRRMSKQNAVSDFIAAAEHLISSGLTTPKQLGLHGASSGGRLVLGAMVQRPELFGAVAAGVALCDMLRFPLHSFGTSWKQEYGDVDQGDEFKALMALSPLHNVKPGVAYPPTLILTADNDQRVAPFHSYKMGATLKQASPQTEVLVRTRRGAGHGSGNALSKTIEYQADVVSFLASRLGGSVLELPKV